MPVDKRESIHHQLDTCDDAALAELLTLNVEVNDQGTTIYRNGSGQMHRIHGPAFISADGHKYWYQMGLRHRTDGPAIESPSYGRYWYLNGEHLTEEEFNERVKSM